MAAQYVPVALGASCECALAQDAHALLPEGLRARGVPAAELDAAKAAIDGALPALATMVMHCCALRVGLALTEREVVRQP